MGARDGHAARKLGSVSPPGNYAPGAPRAPGPGVRVVRVHLNSGLVPQPARAHAGRTAAPDQNGPRHSPGQRYGYEDHYPLWAPAPPGDSADTLRRTAWDIAMAGAYGTAGERHG